MKDLGIVVVDMQEEFAGGDVSLFNQQKILFDKFREHDLNLYLLEFYNCGETLPEVRRNIGSGYNVRKYVKFYNSCFDQKILDEARSEVVFENRLIDDGIKRLIFTGAYGDMCVFDSMRDAVNLGYESFTSEDLNHYFGDVYYDFYKKIGVNFSESLDEMLGKL